MIRFAFHMDTKRWFKMSLHIKGEKKKRVKKPKKDVKEEQQEEEDEEVQEEEEEPQKMEEEEGKCGIKCNGYRSGRLCGRSEAERAGRRRRRKRLVE